MATNASIREIRILAVCSVLALIAAPPTITQAPFVSALLWLAGLASGVLAIAMWVSGKRLPFSAFVEGSLAFKVVVTVGILAMCLGLIALAAITYLGILSVLGIALTENARPPHWSFAFIAALAWYALFRRLVRARRRVQAAR